MATKRISLGSTLRKAVLSVSGPSTAFSPTSSQPGKAGTFRYFRPEQEEEYGVLIDPAGKVFDVMHYLADDAPGESLTRDEALRRAEDALRTRWKADPGLWRSGGRG